MTKMASGKDINEFLNNHFPKNASLEKAAEWLDDDEYYCEEKLILPEKTIFNLYDFGQLEYDGGAIAEFADAFEYWVRTQKEIDPERDFELKDILGKAIETCLVREYWFDTDDAFLLKLADYEILAFEGRTELIHYLSGIIKGVELTQWLTGKSDDAATA